MKTIAIIDYGAGNLKNVKTALEEIGLDGKITSDKSDLDAADAMILPGVGAFPDAMERLEETGLIDTIKKNVQEGKILLGICLGMQMLFDESLENVPTKGLGLIPGTVRPLQETDLKEGMKVPHMGWNSLVIQNEDPFVEDVQTGDYVYYVHSFYADPDLFDKHVLAYSDYSTKVPGIVRLGNVIGTQFHPEKSSEIGFKLLNNFKKIVENDSTTSN